MPEFPLPAIDLASPATDACVWRQRIVTCARWLLQIRWPALGLILTGLLVYAPVLQFQFLNWDDSWYILWNDLIKSWHPANLYSIATESVARNYAPLTISTFLLEYTAWQLWPGGYHATNLALHLVNAVLVLQLLRQLTRNDWLAWTTAALFLLHPVQVESVAWISSRKTLLCTTWMLASAICWLRPERTSRDEAWGLGWLLLALLSKAAAVVLPPIVVAYDVLVARKKLSESLARQAVPMFFCIMLILTTMNAQVSIIGGVRSHLRLSKWRLLAIDGTLLWRYVGMLVAPRDLCVLYDPPVEGIFWWIVLAAAGWLVVAWLLWRARTSEPLITFAGLVWIFLFVPVLNLFPLTTLMNDRYLYLPCVPFFALACGGVLWGTRFIARRFSSPESVRAILLNVAGTAAIGASAWGTLNYLPVWKDPLSLWNYARQQSGQIPMVQIQWAITLEGQGRFDEATETLRALLARETADDAERALVASLLERIANSQSAPDRPLVPGATARPIRPERS